MKIYLAVIGWDYEGTEILGAFADKEKAEQELDKRRTFVLNNNKTYKRGDWAEVQEMEVE